MKNLKSHFTLPEKLHKSHSHKPALEQKKSIFSRKLFVCIILALVFVALLEFVWIIQLNNEFASLQEVHLKFVSDSTLRIDALNSVLFDLRNQNNSLFASLVDINSRFVSLSKSNATLTASYADLSASYVVLRSQADATVEKIDAYENQIQSALDWFKLNSVLGSEEHNVLVDLKADCLRKTSNSCEINLGCLDLINTEFFHLSYKQDLITSQTIDKLQSVKDFFKNRGGDCEDYSLFFKAEVNSLLGACVDKSISIVSWVDSIGHKFWVNYSNTWYLEGAKGKQLDKENIFPIVVCGSMFDPNSNKVNGHCVVAFTSKKIVSLSDVNTLTSAELVEPQAGNYLGRVGIESGIFLINSLGAKNSFIDTVISDNDFFLYSKGKWNSYSKFSDELFVSKTALIELINKAK